MNQTLGQPPPILLLPQLAPPFLPRFFHLFLYYLLPLNFLIPHNTPNSRAATLGWGPLVFHSWAPFGHNPTIRASDPDTLGCVI